MPAIVVKKLRAGTVYWLVAKGLFLGLVPMFAVFGSVLAFGLWLHSLLGSLNIEYDSIGED